MFCQIVSLPRSGSHMLGTALGSHPNLSCKGERLGHNEELYDDDGDIEIVHVISYVPDAKKYIALVRDPDDRDISWQKTTSHHFTFPMILEKEIQPNPNRKLENARKNQKILEKFIENNDCLVLHYDELTSGKDIREIPEKYGRQICEYLGVEYQPLTPLTYKPVVRINEDEG